MSSENKLLLLRYEATWKGADGKIIQREGGNQQVAREQPSGEDENQEHWESGLWSGCTKQWVVATAKGVRSSAGGFLQLMLQLRKCDKSEENWCCWSVRSEPRTTSAPVGHQSCLRPSLQTVPTSSHGLLFFQNNGDTFYFFPPLLLKNHCLLLEGREGALCKHREWEPQPWQISEADKWKNSPLGFWLSWGFVPTSALVSEYWRGREGGGGGGLCGAWRPTSIAQKG